MNKMMKIFPLYLLLGIPATYGCLHFLGNGWGVVLGLVANLSLLHILVGPQKEEGTSDVD